MKTKKKVKKAQTKDAPFPKESGDSYSLMDLMNINLSDRCKLVQVSEEHLYSGGDGVYQLINTETLDTFFIREGTLKNLVKQAKRIFG